MIEKKKSLTKSKELTSRTSLYDKKFYLHSLTSGENLNVIPYIREANILKKLVDHIERSYEMSKRRKLEMYYCSIFAIHQGTGYGKSKLMEKLGSKTPTFYSSLQYGTGFPEKSFFLTRLLEELDKIVESDICYMNNVATAVYIYIIRILYIILINNENKPLKEHFQIDEVGIHEEFWQVRPNHSRILERIFKTLFKGLKELCLSKLRISFNGFEANRLSKFLVNHQHLNNFTVNSQTIKDLEQAVMKKLEEISKYSYLPSIFVIDEAIGLCYKKSGKRYSWNFYDWDLDKGKRVRVHNFAPYNVFRRIFRMFDCTWERLMLIIISINRKVNFKLSDLKLDPSRRKEAHNTFIENFVLANTYNVNSELALAIKADNIPNWNIFLESDERMEEFFKHGRPLIYSTFKRHIRLFPNYSLEAGFEECYEFTILGKKLFEGDEYNQTLDVARLYSMLNFAFGTNFFPSHLRVDDMIENNLMTLIGYLNQNNGVKYIIASFLPEGAFNFLSAKYFVDYPGSLSQILQLSVRYGLCNVGHFGELLAQYALLRTAFYCIDPSIKKVRKLVFESIDLKEFLFALAGYNETMIEGFFELNPELEDSRISFSYFEHFPINPINNPYDLMARCLIKGSAVTLNGLYAGIDLMIPLILEDGRLSFLGIQVKFVKQDGVTTAITKAIEKMTFTNIFEGGTEIRPFALIILALGDYNFEGEKKLKVSLKHGEAENSLNAPTVLVFEGTPKLLLDPTFTIMFNLAPKYFSYRGVCSDHMMACDHLFALINELPFSDDATDVLAKYVPES
jgi:hypothetical protein